MNTINKDIVKISFVFIVLSCFRSVSHGGEPLNFSLSTNYYLDLSDTYGGGSMLAVGFKIAKSWYGLDFSFGHFQSQSLHVLKVPIEEIEGILEIPIEEMTIMQNLSFSGLIQPIHKNWIETDILIGLIFNMSKCFYNKSVDYQYSIPDNKFVYLIKDYQLIKENRIGYHVGLNISFYPIEKIGLQINTRLQDLNNGGTFFFVGGGICFKI